jgi:hypothetical protein
LSRKDVNTGGIYQVRAGLARRIVVKVSAPLDPSRSPADAATGLPLVEISRVAAGDVMAVDSKVGVSLAVRCLFVAFSLVWSESLIAGGGGESAQWNVGRRSRRIARRCVAKDQR